MKHKLPHCYYMFHLNKHRVDNIQLFEHPNFLLLDRFCIIIRLLQNKSNKNNGKVNNLFYNLQ